MPILTTTHVIGMLIPNERPSASGVGWKPTPAAGKPTEKEMPKIIGYGAKPTLTTDASTTKPTARKQPKIRGAGGRQTQKELPHFEVVRTIGGEPVTVTHSLRMRHDWKFSNATTGNV